MQIFEKLETLVSIQYFMVCPIEYATKKPEQKLSIRTYNAKKYFLSHLEIVKDVTQETLH